MDGYLNTTYKLFQGWYGDKNIDRICREKAAKKLRYVYFRIRNQGNQNVARN